MSYQMENEITAWLLLIQLGIDYEHITNECLYMNYYN